LQLVNDASLRNKFSHSGRDYVIEQFSYHRLVRDMGGLYNDLLDKKKNEKK